MKWVELWAAIAHERVPEDTPENNRQAKRSILIALSVFVGFCLLVVIL